jgi:hypothetical protein
MKFFLFALFFVFILGVPSVSAQEASSADIQKENQDLKRRVEKLESELEDIKKNMASSPASSSDSTKPTEGKEKPVVQSKFPVKFYGYIKLDLSYDLARTSIGNYARWVESEQVIDDDDDQFNVTARETRFGFDLEGPTISGIKTSGKVEMDFYGGGPEDANLFRMRLAFIKIEWPDLDFNIIAGQAADVIASVSPTTVNFAPLWWCGNPGFRRPQLRLTKGFAIDDTSKFTFEIAATRTIGDLREFTGIESIDSGEDAGYPTTQARLSYATELLPKKKLIFGIAGLWGEEEYDINNTGKHEEFISWMIQGDITIPLAEKFELKGKIWLGRNVDAYLGGINQGVNLTTQREILARGGFISLAMGPFDAWKFNIGAGLDDPSAKYLNSGNRERNLVIFGNFFYTIVESLEFAMEVAYWETLYEEREKGDSVRVQGAFIYRF